MDLWILCIKPNGILHKQIELRLRKDRPPGDRFLSKSVEIHRVFLKVMLGHNRFANIHNVNYLTSFALVEVYTGNGIIA